MAGILAAVAGWQAVRADAAAGREKSRADEATQARSMAEAKEAEATAVTKFFDDQVLTAPRPGGVAGGRGFGVTVHEALLASLPAVADGFKDQPLVEARLRLTLGRTFYHLGDHRRAAEQLERSRELFALHVPADHPFALTTTNNLAAAYHALDRRQDAIRLREEVLAARRRLLPADDPDILIAANNLAVSYHAARRYPDAIDLCEKVLTGRDPDEDGPLAVRSTLAAVLFESGKADDALRMRTDLLAACRRRHPADHPDTARALVNLAASHHAFGNYPEATKSREEALAIQRRTLPPDHPDILSTLHTLAVSYHMGKPPRLAEALALRLESLAGRRRVLGPDHRDTLTTMHNLANNYSDLGEHEKALALREDVFAARQRILGPNDRDTLSTQVGLAVSYAVFGARPEAVELLDDAVRRATEMPSLIEALNVRMRLFAGKNPAGCRETAELWDRRTGSGNPTVLIQSARYWATAGDPDRAVSRLRSAVALGYKDANRLTTDPGLSALRDRASFRRLLADLTGQSFETAPPPRPADPPG